jgi:Ca-activated chloride channel family protein
LGNEYFYVNLTQRTYGNYSNIRETGGFSVLLNSIAETLSGFIESFDLYTTLQGGFCFGRFNLNPIGTAIFLDRPILQAGKYNGDFPFIVQTSGVYKAQPFSKTIMVETSAAQDADTLAAKIWTGNYISALEAQPESNEIIGQIIKASLDERVLSRYTAFLALEPGDTVEVCFDCKDESDVVISVDERGSKAANDSLLLRAFPNPFNAETTISLNLPSGVKSEDMSLKIYNLLGQVVRTFTLTSDSQGQTQQIKWDGRNDAGDVVATGVYYVIFKTPVRKASLRLVMVK